MYYQPGTIYEAKRLREALQRLGRDFPTSDEVRGLLSEDPSLARIYRFDEVGGTWYLRNATCAYFEDPFKRTTWRLFFESPEGWWSYSIQGSDIVRTLQVMPLLNGQYTQQEIMRAIHGFEPAKRLLWELAEVGAIELTHQIPHSVEDLPEFLFLGHSGLALRQGSYLVVVDPVGVPPNEWLALPERPFYDILSAAAAIVISHHHWDHLHFQTLARIPRDKLFIVPRVRNPSVSNPPISKYLKELGFSNVLECDPWDEVELGGMKLRLVPFHGEPFGLDSRFDAFTYHFELRGYTLYGSVDACYDEAGDMDAIIRRVAEWGRPDFFLFGASGQRHDPPYIAAGLRHFSNELRDRPDLIRYHPDIRDVERWASWLKPRYLVPYAEFLFKGIRLSDLSYIDLTGAAPATLEQAVRTLVEPAHLRWASELRGLADRLVTPVVMLQPMQGVRTS